MPTGLSFVLTAMAWMAWLICTTASGQAAVTNGLTDKPHPDGKTILGSPEGLIGRNYYWYSISSISEEGVRIAALVEAGKKMRIVIDGKVSPDYDEIAWRQGKDPKQTNVFGPGGLHSNYRARTEDKWQLVVDGVPGPKYDFITEPVYSPDGRHIVYAAWNGKEQFMVMDGVPGPVFDEIIPEFLKDNPYEETEVIYSKDSRHFMYKARRGNKWMVVVDGVPGREFDEVAMLNGFAEVVNFFAYQGRVGDRWELFVDGKLQPHRADMARIEQFEISPDGKHFAVIWGNFTGTLAEAIDPADLPKYPFIPNAKINEGSTKSVPGLDSTGSITDHLTPIAGVIHQPDGDYLIPVDSYRHPPGTQWEVRVDDRPSLIFTARDLDFLIFSPDGNHTAFSMVENGKWRAVWDGQAGPECDLPADAYFYDTVFSPDSQHLAYAAKFDGPWRMVADGVPGPPFESIYCDPPPEYGPWYSTRDRSVRYTADSQHLIYRGVNGSHWRVIVDGKPGSPFRGRPPNLYLGPKGGNFAYPVFEGDQSSLMVNGEPGPRSDGKNFVAVQFSPDGNHLSYAVERGQKFYAVVDGLVGYEISYPRDYDFQFSPDSRHLAYASRSKGEAKIILDGRPGSNFDGIGPYVFSPDSAHLAYGASIAKNSFMVVDGRTGPDFDRVGNPSFSPDGLHLAYLGVKDGHSSVVTDGITGPFFDGIASPLVWRADGRLEYLAVETTGDQHNLVRMVVPAGTVSENAQK